MNQGKGGNCMKHWTNTLFAGAILASLSLAGCGTDQTASEKEDHPSPKTAETKEDQPAAAKPAGQSSASNQAANQEKTASSENQLKQQQEAAKSNGSSNRQSEDAAQSKDNSQPGDVQSKSVQSGNSVRPVEKKLQYTVGGQTKTDTAVLEESGNQGFSLYVLPHYELTAEEPYKDIVYFKDKDQLFMRIESMQKNQSLAEFKQSALEQLKAINDKVEPISPPNTSTFKNATAYRTSTKDAVVSAYVIPAAAHPIKVTIFDDKNLSHSDAFLKMADTIQLR